MFHVAYLFALFGFLRVGEFTAQSNTDIRRALDRDDIELEFISLKVRIRFSKTDQYGQITFTCLKGRFSSG